MSIGFRTKPKVMIFYSLPISIDTVSCDRFKNTNFMQIIFDRCHRGVVINETIFIKRFSQLEDLIIRLDQEEFTEIIVKDIKIELHLCGGNENFICSFSKHRDVYDLINNEPILSRKHIPIIIAGEELLYSPTKIISIENALIVAEYFFEHGEMDNTLKWKKRSL